MFGNPAWFREKTIGWGLRPVCWQGWVYTVAWMGAISGPFGLLTIRHQAPEALIWLVTSMSILIWDVWGVRRSLRSADEREVLYIDDDGVCSRRDS